MEKKLSTIGKRGREISQISGLMGATYYHYRSYLFLLTDFLEGFLFTYFQYTKV
jgi:hypothetical protein